MKSASPIKPESVRFRVIKVGGSLFTLPDLQKRLLDWSLSVADRRYVNIWIAGGGALVDEVRNWQSLHGLEEHTAHRISIGLMSQTAELLKSLFSDWPLLRDIHQLELAKLKLTPNVVLDCHQWSLDNATLEKSWETTSDTISLRLAVAVGASHLFLLKSRLPKSDRVADAIEEGLVDQNFTTGWCERSQLVASIVDIRATSGIVELTP